ncbi:hypothetical protein [Actinomadura flavalba]|uniref:hypothetical protein n=1 Tax=Actinomadura flavalba TaxID=1120938 RepID=UPI000369D5D2|nr:hypothetical protein [Actinomadura flavalba]
MMLSKHSIIAVNLPRGTITRSAHWKYAHLRVNIVHGFRVILSTQHEERTELPVLHTVERITGHGFIRLREIRPLR